MSIVTKLAFLILASVLFIDIGVATERDPKADLITISARFVEVHSRIAHKAGDADEQFIEDVVTPSVHNVVEKGGSNLTNAQRDAVIKFILASESSASEEVSEIAVKLYSVQKAKLCASVANLNLTKRIIVLDRIRSGLAATNKSATRTICP